MGVGRRCGSRIYVREVKLLDCNSESFRPIGIRIKWHNERDPEILQFVVVTHCCDDDADNKIGATYLQDTTLVASSEKTTFF